MQGQAHTQRTSMYTGLLTASTPAVLCGTAAAATQLLGGLVASCSTASTFGLLQLNLLTLQATDCNPNSSMGVMLWVSKRVP